jgi:hypothetical protein
MRMTAPLISANKAASAQLARLPALAARRDRVETRFARGHQ